MPWSPLSSEGSLGSFFLVEAEVMFWAGRGMFKWGLLEVLRLLLCCGVLSLEGIGSTEVIPLTEHWALLAPDSMEI